MNIITKNISVFGTRTCNRNNCLLLVYRSIAIFTLCLMASACAVQPGQHIPAFLPMADSVPRSESLDIDGIWRINTLGKRIRIEDGRAYAVDDWLHLFTLHVQPNIRQPDL